MLPAYNFSVFNGVIRFKVLSCKTVKTSETFIEELDKLVVEGKYLALQIFNVDEMSSFGRESARMNLLLSIRNWQMKYC